MAEVKDLYRADVDAAAKRVELRRSRLYALASGMTFVMSLAVWLLGEREVRKLDR